jgi:hypothetical protein
MTCDQASVVPARAISGGIIFGFAEHANNVEQGRALFAILRSRGRKLGGLWQDLAYQIDPKPDRNDGALNGLGQLNCTRDDPLVY